MTDAESCLWSRLRSRQLLGLKFRRQHPVGNYVVDFICLEKKLVVELDGGQHLNNTKDQRRDDWLKAEGYRILRYWNNQVLRETDGVVEDIIRNAITPSP